MEGTVVNLIWVTTLVEVELTSDVAVVVYVEDWTIVAVVLLIGVV